MGQRPSARGRRFAEGKDAVMSLMEGVVPAPTCAEGRRCESLAMLQYGCAGWSVYLRSSISWPYQLLALIHCVHHTAAQLQIQHQHQVGKVSVLDE